MAKKSRKRTQRAAASRQTSASSGGGKRRLIVGGLVLLLVVVIVVGIRASRQHNLPIQLQGATDNHYVRGTPNAPVVIKEFSDYT